MSVELYSDEIIVVAVAQGPRDYKIWLRTEAEGGFAGDLQWLCGEDMDSHVVLDLADIANLEVSSYRLILDLQKLVEDSDRRLVLCGLSAHLKWQIGCVHLSEEFEAFETREAAILELSSQPQD